MTSLVAGDSGVCALVTGGAVDCWGAGDRGQLGNGTFYRGSHSSSAVPVQVLSPAT